MKRAFPAFLVLAIAAVPLTAPADADAKKKRRPVCERAKGQTLESNARARAYITVGPSFSVYGCLLGSKKRVLLGSGFSCNCSIGDDPRPQVFLAETVVAVNEYTGPPGGQVGNPSGTVEVTDLKTRKRLQFASTSGFVTGLVLKTNGSFAFIDANQLRKQDSNGPGVLDPGPGIEAGSLALSASGSRVY